MGAGLRNEGLGMKVLYVVQCKKNKRWEFTYWTRQGKPVSKAAAVKAMARALREFPQSMFRIAESKLEA